MRQIGSINNESQARQVGDYLYVSGYANTVEQETEQKWAIWIHDEEHLSQAAEIFSKFQDNPASPQFAGSSEQAAKIRREAEKGAIAYEKKIKAGRITFRRFGTYQMGGVTLIVILISAAVFLCSKSARDPKIILPLLFSEVDTTGGWTQRLNSMPEIRHGQIWRLVTPIFIHFTILHIILNMLWLRDLGSMIERTIGSLRFLLLLLILGVVSNLGQFLTSGPLFGGMSGVVYGLLGYVWIRGKFDPASGLYLHPSTVMMMMAWFLICLTGWIGSIANTAHGVGLAGGMLWGFIAAQRRIG